MSRDPADLDQEIFATVQRCFCEALELDPEEVPFHARILDDLGAESLDLLDVVFRLERAFGIQIPRGGVGAKATEIDGEPGEIDGRLTEAAVLRLRAHMPEVPPGEITPGMRADELPNVFRVGTFYHMVRSLIAEQTKA